MMDPKPFRYFRPRRDVIRLVVILSFGFRLSLRKVEDLPHERGIVVSHDAIGFWWPGFDPVFAADIRKKRAGKSFLPFRRSCRRCAVLEQGPKGRSDVECEDLATASFDH
jgi:putative transposase